MTGRYSLCLLLFLICFQAESPAQPRAPFSTLRLQAGGGLPAGDNALSRHWRLAPAGDLILSTPFYTGELRAGIRYSRFRNREDRNGYSDFHSLFFRLGWALPLETGGRFRLRPSLSIGNHFMRFDTPMSYSRPGASWSHIFDRSESEIAWEASVEGEYRLGESWSLFGSVGYNRTLTFHPLEQWLLSIGVSRSLRTPRWLRSLLE